MKWLVLVVLVACSSEPEVQISFSGAGAYLEASDASGATAWTLSKITRGHIGNGSPSLTQEVRVAGAACDGASTCAVFGSYLYGSGASRPWMEVMTVP